MVLPLFLTGQQSSKFILHNTHIHKWQHMRLIPPFCLAHGQRSTKTKFQYISCSWWPLTLPIMPKKPILKVLTSVPHSVGSKIKVSSWLRSSPDEPDGGADEQLTWLWSLRSIVSLTIRVNPERAGADRQLPKAGPSVIMGRQPPKADLRLVRVDWMATPTHIGTQSRW